nr:hypothetical protein [Deltaproteobacteria bacterium]
MQKQPVERPRSAAEVLEALASILEQESTAMAPGGRPAAPVTERDGAGETDRMALKKSAPSSVSILTLRAAGGDLPGGGGGGLRGATCPRRDVRPAGASTPTSSGCAS